MNEATIVIGSVTYAVRAKRILTSNGIPCRTVKTDASDEHGCGYGVIIDYTNVIRSVALLRENKIEYRTIIAGKK